MASGWQPPLLAFCLAVSFLTRGFCTRKGAHLRSWGMKEALEMGHYYGPCFPFSCIIRLLRGSQVACVTAPPAHHQHEVLRTVVTIGCFLLS